MSTPPENTTPESHPFCGSLFEAGALAATPRVLAAVDVRDIRAALLRHARGDWGELDAEDKEANQTALTHGGRLLSAYRSTGGTRFWIITESDRSATTVLLPSEY